MQQWYETVNQLEGRGERYVLITVMGARGSTPRNSGTKMIVTENKNYATIGGGHLEFKAIATANKMLQQLAEPAGEIADQQKIVHFPLGAKLGQCCGGSVTLLFELFAGSQLNIMLFGAGHVGKSLAAMLAQLPCKLFWVDSREDQFPDEVPANVEKIISDCAADEVASMPAKSYYIVMTHDHSLDFEITENILKRDDAGYVGLIGSAHKWQRFEQRFEHRQYSEKFYAPVHCPVGLEQVPGKLPVEVAVSIAAEIIQQYHCEKAERDVQQGVSWCELKVLT